MILIPTNARTFSHGSTAPEKPSHIRGIGYDLPTATLRAVFQGGGTYDYSPVPPEVAALVIFAESVGSALDQFVKKPAIPFVKLDGVTII